MSDTPIADPATTTVPVGLLTSAEFDEVSAHETAVRQGDFVLRWVGYEAERTDAPTELVVLNGLVLVATVTDRRRWLALQQKTVYPSVYGLGLAPSGYRKSTPMMHAQAVMLSACKDRRLSNEYSAEGLIADLGDRNPSRGTAYIDEAGRLLGTMRRDRYAEGLKDCLAQQWDCPDEYSRRLIRGTYTLRSVYVNFVMATTPSRFLETVTREDLSSGFLARFLPVWVTAPITRRPLARRTSANEETEEELTEWLKGVFTRTKPEGAAMPIAEDALARIDQAEVALGEWAAHEYHADLLEPWGRRLADYAARLSIIYAVSEESGRVERVHVLRAIALLDRAKEDARMIVEELVKGAEARELEKVERFIRDHPGITPRDLYRRANLTAGKAKAILGELTEQGRITSTKDGKYFAVVGGLRAGEKGAA